MVVQLHPICRPPFLVRSPREHCFGFFNIFEYLQHLCPEMFATRITQLPKISVSSVRRLDLLGMRMEEDELPQPRSDASTWIAWPYDGTIQDLKIHIAMTEALTMDYGTQWKCRGKGIPLRCCQLLQNPYLYSDALQRMLRETREKSAKHIQCSTMMSTLNSPQCFTFGSVCLSSNLHPPICVQYPVLSSAKLVSGTTFWRAVLQSLHIATCWIEPIVSFHYGIILQNVLGWTSFLGTCMSSPAAPVFQLLLLITSLVSKW